MTQLVREYTSIPTLKAFHLSGARSRMLVGPFRSGKSVAALIELIQMAKDVPIGGVKASAIQDKIICRTMCVRKTYRMLEDSVIKTFFQWVPKGAGKWKDQDKVFLFPLGNGYMWEVLFRSADTPEDIEKFRGVEITNFWIDEAVEVSQDVKLILEGRMSYPAGAPAGCFRSVLTTNPCDTEHWLYRDYVSNPLPGHAYWRQGARENPYLTKEYYDNLEAIYRDRPEIKRRYIDGEWGAIFSGKPVYGNEFNHDFHVSKEHLKPVAGVELACGWDFGLTPACVITQVLPDGRWAVLRELYSDDMGIDEFGDLVVDFCNREFPGFTFRDVGDPAGRQRSTTDEKSCMDILRTKKRNCRAAGTNALLPRLESVKRMLTKTSKGRARVVIDPRCKRLIDGFSGGYRYVERANTGMHADTPEKNLYSHCLAAGTMVATPDGIVPIELINVGDYVLTPVGIRRVTATMNREVDRYLEIELTSGKVINATEDHPFYTKKGIVRADALQYNTSLVGMNSKEGRGWEDIENIRLSSSKESRITESHLDTTNQTSRDMADAICIALYGKASMAQYPMEVVFTTPMGIKATIGLKTFCSLLQRDTPYITPKRILERYPSAWDGGLLRLKRQLKSGMDQKKDWNGTRSTGSALGKGERRKNLSVRSVVRNIWHTLRRLKEVFVVCLANRKIAAPKVSGSTLIRKPIKVFDITVEDAHCFYAEGVLVSNCHDALQYIAMDLFGYAERNTQIWKEPLNVRGIVNA